MSQVASRVFVGHDAEGFIIDGKGVYISSIGKIGGTKQQPFPVPKSFTGLKVQEDNVTIELNNTPIEVGSTRLDVWNRWEDFILTAREEAVRFVQSKISPRHNIAFVPVAEFPEVVLEDPKACEFGCDPDYLAHEYGKLRPALSAKDLLKAEGPVRFAGGHVHIGYDRKQHDSWISDWALIQLIEAYVYFGQYMEWDRQQTRRKYYGLAGLYRPKDYGVEYRTPSNFWVSSGAGRSFPMACGVFAKAVLQDQELAKRLYNSVDMMLVARIINDPTISLREHAGLRQRLQLEAQAAYSTVIVEEEQVREEEDLPQPELGEWHPEAEDLRDPEGDEEF